MDKEQVIEQLLQDFIKMFPDSNRATKMQLKETLGLMEVHELLLLLQGSANGQDKQ